MALEVNPMEYCCPCVPGKQEEKEEVQLHPFLTFELDGGD
jgi:hypothetical protein